MIFNKLFLLNMGGDSYAEYELNNGVDWGWRLIGLLLVLALVVVPKIIGWIADLFK